MCSLSVFFELEYVHGVLRISVFQWKGPSIWDALVWIRPLHYVAMVLSTEESLQIFYLKIHENFIGGTYFAFDSPTGEFTKGV